jgi:DNA-binding MarR family transcriptional regulator
MSFLQTFLPDNLLSRLSGIPEYWHNSPRMATDPHIGISSAALAEQLRDRFRQVIDYVYEHLRENGFTDIRPAHMTIFQNLKPEGSRIGELAEAARITNQSVGYLVDYMEEHGYAERRPDPSNRRATLVCLTEHGWAAMECCAVILAELDSRLEKHLGARRLAELDALLTDLQAALGDAPSGGPGVEV